VVNLTLLYIYSEVVIPAKAGIQLRKTGFPRIKYGAGLVKPGMTNKEKEFMTHYNKERINEIL
jgi:hypothetical protein